MYNIFLEAGVILLAKFPLTQFLVTSFQAGEAWLKGGVDVLRNQGTGDLKCPSPDSRDPDDPRGCVDQDMNTIAMLWSAHDAMATPLTLMAIASYRSRAHSYGSYFRQYCTTYGPVVTNDQCDKYCVDNQLFSRLKAGIAKGWQPDEPGIGPYGAVRWYNRWSTGANPGLAILWEPIIKDLVR
jgi:hypothetical protein